MTTPLIVFSMASAGRKIYAHTDIYTRRSTEIMAHESGRQLFGMDVREIRISLRDDAEDGYNLDGREISNFG